jgi:hypothetical protein
MGDKHIMHMLPSWQVLEDLFRWYSRKIMEHIGYANMGLAIRKRYNSQRSHHLRAKAYQLLRYIKPQHIPAYYKESCSMVVNA